MEVLKSESSESNEDLLNNNAMLTNQNIVPN